MQLTWLLILCLAVACAVGKKDSSSDSDEHDVKHRHSHTKDAGKGHHRMRDEPIARAKRAETDYHVRGRIYQPDRVRVKANIAERTTLSPREAEIEEQTRRNHARVIEEMKARFSNYRENCYPRPKNGCRCVENSKVVLYDRDELCRVRAG
ncbi:hypothetical protein M514_01453 [Trichuris suis]|uniref:Secreted protein n=1 Tax=Trichuris suis TaxID=68888 RepID=A0A085MKN7_9BILA|nr:hypothetical protein M513_01453 [Trichuris suis]KFD65492.1 hypothetical protein M514_01453 [Trichuris suis]KHJ49470.1 hypothetical protein D918_00597 [Trichuris suis]